MSKSKIIVGLLLLSSVIGAPAFAAKATTMTCPACHMAMATKKNAMMTVPVYSKANKTVYYCCPQCAAGTKAAAYMKAHHHPMPV